MYIHGMHLCIRKKLVCAMNAMPLLVCHCELWQPLPTGPVVCLLCCDCHRAEAWLTCRRTSPVQVAVPSIQVTLLGSNLLGNSGKASDIELVGRTYY